MVATAHAMIGYAMRVGLIGLFCALPLTVIAAYAQVDGKLLSRLPGFERLVADQRLKQIGQEPVRMVVYDKDHSPSATTNSFEQVIYNETDKIDHNPDALNGLWPDPNSPTGLTDVGSGRRFIERISGHFYHVWIADP